MAILWDKAAFTAAYSICPRGRFTYPDGHTEDRRFVEIRLHYHPAVMKPIAKRRADRLQALNKITSASKVLVFGAGFGWLCEELSSRIGCTVIGVDTSDYIINNKDLSPDDELLESLDAANISLESELGSQIWAQFSQPTKARSEATVLQLDMLLAKDRTTLKQALGTPTHIITEDVWQELNVTEQTDLASALEKLGGEVIHITHEVIV
jgi:hypothetical protein